MKILITAGPTRERLDPVRYLTNDSSGKMGYALAQAAKDAGHAVILISGPVRLEPIAGIQTIFVESAHEMLGEVLKHFPKCDAVIKTAAVADYRPKVLAKQKIKKTTDTLTLTLVKNPDILASLGKNKKKNQILVGFAAETQNIEKNARVKLKKKNCDWIIANNVSKKGIGFNSDLNQVTLFGKDGRKIKLPKMSKTKLATKILQVILP